LDGSLAVLATDVLPTGVVEKDVGSETVKPNRSTAEYDRVLSIVRDFVR
jgi:hypothetical protein